MDPLTPSQQQPIKEPSKVNAAKEPFNLETALPKFENDPIYKKFTACKWTTTSPNYKELIETLGYVNKDKGFRLEKDLKELTTVEAETVIKSQIDAFMEDVAYLKKMLIHIDDETAFKIIEFIHSLKDETKFNKFKDSIGKYIDGFVVRVFNENYLSIGFSSGPNAISTGGIKCCRRVLLHHKQNQKFGVVSLNLPCDQGLPKGQEDLPFEKIIYKELHEAKVDNIPAYFDTPNSDNPRLTELVLEFIPFSLENTQTLSQNELFTLGRDISNVLKALHDRDICHLDTDAKNILYKEENGKKKFYLIDFSTSIRLNQEGSASKRKNALTHHRIKAPEFDTTEGPGTPADIFALGITLKSKAPSPLDPEINAFINKMIDNDPEKRPTAKEVYDTFNKKLN